MDAFGVESLDKEAVLANDAARAAPDAASDPAPEVTAGAGPAWLAGMLSASIAAQAEDAARHAFEGAVAAGTVAA
eukprot:4518620-Alexandrium_andersonii.AAC.1